MSAFCYCGRGGGAGFARALQQVTFILRQFYPFTVDTAAQGLVQYAQIQTLKTSNLTGKEPLFYGVNNTASTV